MPEPELDAQLEKAYLLEKEDANSGDEDVVSGSDEDEESVMDGEAKEPLAKKQKRQDEVRWSTFCFHFRFLSLNFSPEKENGCCIG